MKLKEYFSNKKRIKLDLWTMIITLILFIVILPKPNIPPIFQQSFVESVPQINLLFIIGIVCILFFANKYLNIEQYRYLCHNIGKERIKIPSNIMIGIVFLGIILISYIFYCDPFMVSAALIILTISFHIE